MSFARHLFAVMADHGDRPAMVSDHEQLSHRQAVEQAAHLAANLAAAGVQPGDRIGISVQDGHEVILCVMACWQLAATPAVIDFRTPHAQRARLAQDFELAAVLENRAPPAGENYPSLVFNRDWRFASPSSYAPQGEIDCSNPAFLLFSSGTTGVPKAYVQSHDMLMGRNQTQARPQDDALPRYFTPVSMSFAAARGYVFAVLFAGGVVRFFPPLFTPSELAEELLSFRATGTSLPPPVIARLVVEAGERSSVLFPDLGEMRSIGGPARPEDKLAAWRNLTRGYSISYSSTLTGRVSMLRGEDILAKPESSGRLMPRVRVEILDDQGRELPRGEHGIIKAWTPTIAPAVLLPGNKPFVDPKVMGPGWGIAGDIGFLDDDGFLTIVGRMEDMIVRGGVNVAPQELEKLIVTHPKVAEVAVVGFDDAVMGQEIGVFAVTTQDLTVGELRSFIAANLPPEKRPREIRIVNALPYNNNGKLLRRVLAEDLARERQSAAS